MMRKYLGVTVITGRNIFAVEVGGGGPCLTCWRRDEIINISVRWSVKSDGGKVFSVRTLGGMVRDLRAFLRFWSLRLTPWPVYFWSYSRDCDLFEVTRAVRFSNGWRAVRGIEDSYEDAEGPVSWERINRADYESLRADGPITRDIAAEQMNY